ncbi:hypothetical protein [uncultured Nostoc sp.]|uniref:hypothetical protein n=1 Tax=uncultured Nostoc sp. TaxID=340711 RepID=UPI0035CA4488
MVFEYFLAPQSQNYRQQPFLGITKCLAMITEDLRLEIVANAKIFWKNLNSV